MLQNLLQQTSVLNSKNVTVCSQGSDAFIASTLLSTLMRVVIPFIFMLALNLLVIRKLKQSKVRVGIAQIASQIQNQQNARQFSNREFRFMVSTLIIDSVFLIFYLPITIALSILVYNLFSTSLTSNPVANAIYNLFLSIAQMLALGHTSALFFVFLILNRTFRAELIILMRFDKLISTLKPGSSMFFTNTNNSIFRRNNN